ncbi:unnamed protein product [Symbiodinium sp. CCMP2592]|nr:unnamed protein product [Symbiodinium sp. CCMP2592]
MQQHPASTPTCWKASKAYQLRGPSLGRLPTVPATRSRSRSWLPSFLFVLPVRRMPSSPTGSRHRSFSKRPLREQGIWAGVAVFSHGGMWATIQRRMSAPLLASASGPCW